MTGWEVRHASGCPSIINLQPKFFPTEYAENSPRKQETDDSCLYQLWPIIGDCNQIPPPALQVNLTTHQFHSSFLSDKRPWTTEWLWPVCRRCAVRDSVSPALPFNVNGPKTPPSNYTNATIFFECATHREALSSIVHLHVFPFINICDFSYSLLNMYIWSPHLA